MSSLPFFIKMFTYFLLMVIGGFALFFVTSAYAEHVDVHNEYVIHKPIQYYGEIHELLITPIYVQSESDPACKKGFAMNSRGECTDVNSHWDEYPLYLMAMLPDDCGGVAGLICVNFVNKGIFIKNGLQGQVPKDYGCSYLWMAIKLIKYSHYEIFEQWPNSDCSTNYIGDGFNMPVYVAKGIGYKEIELRIVKDRQSLLEEDIGLSCNGNWMGCAQFYPDRIYMLEEFNGCQLYHELQHHMGMVHKDPRMFENCGNWPNKLNG